MCRSSSTSTIDLAHFKALAAGALLYDSAALWNVNNGLYTWMMERVIFRADAVTVSTRSLN